jgi:hypothetical protein
MAPTFGPLIADAADALTGSCTVDPLQNPFAPRDTSRASISFREPERFASELAAGALRVRTLGEF